jgi:polyisoprenoid-binding protein YceI
MPGTRTKLTPVESICGGAVTGLWLLDPEASRVQFTLKQFWGLFALRGKFDRFEGCIDIDERGSVGGSLIVNAGSVITATARADEHLRSAGLFSTGWDPVIVFQSRNVLLIMPDQVWVMGSLTAAGLAEPVAFETRIRTHTRRGALVVDARIKTNRFRQVLPWVPRFRLAGSALLTLHLVFVRR